MNMYTAIDCVCGTRANGNLVPESLAAEATHMLREDYGIEGEALSELTTQHRSEIIRDAKDTPQGCSFPNCTNAAVWERVFYRGISAVTMLSVAMTVASFSPASPVRLLMFPGASDFEHMRLGASQLEGKTVSHQYGCWEHVGGFLGIPNKGGKYTYDIVSAKLPSVRPHAIWGISDEVWNFLKTAERAQNIGFPESPRDFCSACGLPYEHATGIGLRPGEGDDFWKLFCEYCGNEMEINDSEV